jgi:hypothetical protein
VVREPISAPYATILKEDKQLKISEILQLDCQENKNLNALIEEVKASI